MSKAQVVSRDSEPRIDKMLQPFYEFVKIESSGGMVLILATIIALIWANSPWGHLYEAFKNMPLTVGAGDFVLSKPLSSGLMTVDGCLFLSGRS